MREEIETVTVDFWRRIPRDAEIEEATITMPEKRKKEIEYKENIVLFVNAEIHLTLEGADIQGVPHIFFFLTPYQFAAAVDRDTFLIPALLCQMGNVQDSRFVIDGEVKPLHHTVLHENIHEKLIPAPFLRQQIAFKLAAATPFQFQQHPFFQFR